jgi:uncharacterized membrane protein
MAQQKVTNGHTLTAVEWLMKTLSDGKYIHCNQIEANFIYSFIDIAKAKEKQQIEKAFEEGGVQYMCNIGDDRPPKSEDYYNKTYQPNKVKTDK